MFGQKLKHKVLGAAAAGALVMAVGVSPAHAVITFTWDPFGGGISTPGSIFTANNITVADYARINIPVNPSIPGSITETGFLVTTAFDLQPPSVSQPGYVNGTGTGILGAQPGAAPYQLYYSFTSTSHLNNMGGGVFVGAFDSVNYTLFGDTGGNCDFGITGGNPSISGCSGAQVALANGTLSGNGLNQVSVIGGIPSANVQLTFNELMAGFFVSPPANITLEMESSFTNTPGVVTRSPTGCPTTGLPCTITINGGGGNLDFVAVVPEPASLLLLGTGLLGFAGMRRRRNKR